MRTHSPHKPAQYPSTELAEAGEWATVCTNKPHPFAKNIYYVMFVYSVDCI